MDRRFKYMRGAALMLLVGFAGCGSARTNGVWRHGGFAAFAQGSFSDGGSNLYVNANGTIEMIYRLDVNDDGYVDLVLANSHDYIERGPTNVFSLDDSGNPGKPLPMSADSGWMSRIIDLDKDGFADLIVANATNGVTSELLSYVYWGGPKGLGTERADLPTVGAHDVAVLDIDRDGRLDLVFPSAWEDGHNAGVPIPARVYLAQPDRKFTDATERYGITGVAAVGIAEADLNQDGHVDLVLANCRQGHDENTESFVYWGTKDGVDTTKPIRLPTHAARAVTVADLNRDGKEDILFSGGNRVQIYWNDAGSFDSANQLVIEPTEASEGAVAVEVADVDGDGHNDLILATGEGLQIRSTSDLEKAHSVLPLSHAGWVTAYDLNQDGLKDLIVSRHHDGLTYDTESAVLWNGPSGFSPEQVTWFPTGGAVGNTAGDLDGDGRPEVVFNNTMSGHLRGIYNYIYLGNKDADYGVESRIILPTDGGDVSAIADLDLDGYPEVVFAETVAAETGRHSGFRIYKGGPDGPIPDRFAFLGTHNTLQGLRVADFNRDGYLDLFAGCQVYDTKPESLAKSGAIYYGSKKGFSESRRQVIEIFGGSVHAADVNKDGYLDLLFAEKRKQVLIYLGGEGGYSAERTWKVPCPGLARYGFVNTADLNGDGWLDLLVSTMGHYARIKDTLYIYYGSDKGYSSERSQRYLGDYSPHVTGVADFNNDGNLDVLVPAYSSATARVLPAQVFLGNGKTIDFDRPLNLPAYGSTDPVQVDLNRDGWIDAFLICHRNDVGHQVDSLIYWNSPRGFSTDKVTRVPGLGPHGSHYRNHGNAYTREPQESYVSPPFDMGARTAERIHWLADAPPPSKLRFQLRWAATAEELTQAEWTGPGGADTYFEQSGQPVSIPPGDARWLQYRAVFVSPYGCRSPRLREVLVDLKPQASD